MSNQPSILKENLMPILIKFELNELTLDKLIKELEILGFTEVCIKYYVDEYNKGRTEIFSSTDESSFLSELYSQSKSKSKKYN